MKLLQRGACGNGGCWLPGTCFWRGSPETAVGGVFVALRLPKPDRRAGRRGGLASAPDSPGKSPAVGAFAAKVHPYEPVFAMQWLETLPQGSDRNKALEAIHRGMQENKNYEKEAVDAFVREPGFSK